MKISRRHVFLAAAAVAVAALAWLVFRPAPIRVDVGAVRRGDLQVTVDEEGETRVRERYVVAAPTTGRVLRIALDEGDSVKAGALVARIQAAPLDPRDRAAAEARLEAAEANHQAADARVSLAKATAAQARRSARRADELRKSGTLSAEAHEEAHLELTRAKQETEAARFAADAATHEVDAARAALIAAYEGSAAGKHEDDCRSVPCVDVRAPVSGEVLRVREESERIVTAGTPLIEIGDPKTLEIVVDVLSKDAVRIHPGAPVQVEDWGGGHALRARVRRVEPSAFTKISALGVEEQRVNVIADFVDPPTGLGDGYRLEARIVVWQGSDVLQVPTGALFRTGNAWSVFVVEGGVARRRGVEIGHRGSAAAEVVKGLQEGDAVILHPSDRLRDGSRVKPLG